ncbi:MAG: type II secretion system F family protein [Endomicrobia bacterium]|nr:type II secretion system F family protein [Endomicrobiia bacterium]MCL2507346.1 type II secretion system F family protein [Endomicrobiia bacterium]
MLMLTSLIICVFAAIFFLIFSLVKGISAKKEKKKISYKTMGAKNKRIILAIIVFLASAVIIKNIIFALIFCGLYLYFDWYFKAKKAKELSALIDKQVIEALSIIKNAVQSGQSLVNAVNTAAAELKEPIKSEFVSISERISLGESFDKALNDISEKSPSKEFRLMIDTIIISKDSGASLSGIFDRITDATVQRVTIQSKINALTAQGRMSGNIVSVIPFVVILMMYVIEPDMMSSLFTTTAGNILLLIVVVMVLTGSFVIRKMTEIDY